MNTIYEENNHITLMGKLTSEKRFSHEIYGERFYVFNLNIPRLSGVADIIPITISERLINDETLKEGQAEGELYIHRKAPAHIRGAGKGPYNGK